MRVLLREPVGAMGRKDEELDQIGRLRADDMANLK